MSTLTQTQPSPLLVPGNDSLQAQCLRSLTWRSERLWVPCLHAEYAVRPPGGSLDAKFREAVVWSLIQTLLCRPPALVNGAL